MKTDIATVRARKSALDNLTAEQFNKAVAELERGTDGIKIFKVDVSSAAINVYTSAVIAASSETQVRSLIDTVLTFDSEGDYFSKPASLLDNAGIVGEEFYLLRYKKQKITNIEYLGEAAPGIVPAGKTMRIILSCFYGA